MPLDDEHYHEPASDDHNALVPTTRRPEPLSFLDLSNGQVLAIDHWLKVNEFGLMSLGKSDGMVKAISAVLDMSEDSTQCLDREGLGGRAEWPGAVEIGGEPRTTDDLRPR